MKLKLLFRKKFGTEKFWLESGLPSNVVEKP
jgi:hypothetical protein